MDDMPTLINLYANARAIRLEKSHELDKLQMEENRLKKLIIDLMKAGKVKTYGNATATVTLQKKIKPIATNWPDLYKYILRTEEFDLLQKRLMDSAISARWKDEIVVPGVEAFPIDDLSISKI